MLVAFYRYHRSFIFVIARLMNWHALITSSFYKVEVIYIYMLQQQQNHLPILSIQRFNFAGFQFKLALSIENLKYKAPLFHSVHKYLNRLGPCWTKIFSTLLLQCSMPLPQNNICFCRKMKCYFCLLFCSSIKSYSLYSTIVEYYR